jgi:hypothetical protein
MAQMGVIGLYIMFLSSALLQHAMCTVDNHPLLLFSNVLAAGPRAQRYAEEHKDNMQHR